MLKDSCKKKYSKVEGYVVQIWPKSDTDISHTLIHFQWAQYLGQGRDGAFPRNTGLEAGQGTMYKLILVSQLIGRVLRSGRKPEKLQKKHTDMGRTQAQDWITDLELWNSNATSIDKYTEMSWCDQSE